MKGPHISIVAEELTHFFGIGVSNSLLTTWLVMVAMVLVAYFVTRRLNLVPSRLQSMAEMVIEGILGLITGLLGPSGARKFFPLLATIFLLIIFSNWSGLLPGVGPIGVYHGHEEFIPLFRAPTADLNTTIALGLVAVVSIQYAGLQALGSHYLQKFFNFSNPINFFVGILEIISEFSRLVSFTFRLFGNIFAGEVLLAVVAFLIPVIVPIPFLGMEIFVGLIQALVFMMLTATFLSMAVSREGH